MSTSSTCCSCLRVTGTTANEEVIFSSPSAAHEALPAVEERWSVTGWLSCPQSRNTIPLVHAELSRVCYVCGDGRWFGRGLGPSRLLGQSAKSPGQRSGDRTRVVVHSTHQRQLVLWLGGQKNRRHNRPGNPCARRGHHPKVGHQVLHPRTAYGIRASSHSR